VIEAVSTFTDCLAGLAFEAGKERFDNKVDEKNSVVLLNPLLSVKQSIMRPVPWLRKSTSKD